ncbi:MAG: DNA-processing protein DprA [Muribaculaceae bacterium]|nr:DNA-processing protein DprA [Muribaculaceae bacterium]
MDQLYKIALSFLPKINADFVFNMQEKGVTPEEIFTMSSSEVSNALQIDENQFSLNNREEAVSRAEVELKFMKRHSIRAYYLGDRDYPNLLRETATPPVILYQLGEGDLQSDHIISIVGTRKCTAYGYNFCKQLVDYLTPAYSDLIVVSGLAYGIDEAAHEASLSCGCKTVGVLAHGLDMIYPAAHRNLAQRILKAGGCLLTEYPSGEKPYRQRFLERNRIVATISNGVVVVESDVKGGAMSTASIAFSYSRDVLALPGKLSDKVSSGCNLLIRQHKADIITCPEDVEHSLMWESDRAVQPQKSLFPEIEGDAKIIYDILLTHEKATIDMVKELSGLHISKVMEILTEMELDDIVIRHPGNRFTIL